MPCKFSKYSFRTCVDELPDYKVMCQLYDSLFNGCPLDFDEAVDWLNGHSDVLKLNHHVQHSAVNQKVISDMNKSFSESSIPFHEWDFFL